jgi:hypothetical protein
MTQRLDARQFIADDFKRLAQIDDRLIHPPRREVVIQGDSA